MPARAGVVRIASLRCAVAGRTSGAPRGVAMGPTAPLPEGIEIAGSVRSVIVDLALAASGSDARARRTGRRLLRGGSIERCLTGRGVVERGQPTLCGLELALERRQLRRRRVELRLERHGVLRVAPNGVARDHEGTADRRHLPGDVGDLAGEVARAPELRGDVGLELAHRDWGGVERSALG